MIVRSLLAVLMAAATLLVAACSDDDPVGTGTDGAARSAELVLDWYPNADHAGIYGALGEGHWDERGLTVRPTVPSDAAAALKQVGAGRAPFAVSYAPEVLLARAEGIPVVAIGALVVHPLNSVIARTDRGITRPRDLEGKTVGATGLPLDRPMLETVVRADGGDPSKVTVRNVGFNLAPALAAGRVDAVVGAYWNIELVDLEAQGVPVRAFRVEEHGVPDYDELVVVTGERALAEDPDLARDLLAGLRRGQDWAATDQSGAVEHLLDANPDLERESLAEQIALTADLLSPPDDRTLVMDPAGWAGLADWMYARDLLPSRVDAAAAMTNAYLPEDG